MQEETVLEYIEEAQMEMDDALEFLKKEFAKIQAGKATPAMLSGITVDYYGAQTPLNQVATVQASDSRTLTISPWEKSMIAPIERSIFEANLGLTPQNNGEMIIINVPILTEERRKSLVKQAKSYVENAKIGIRGARRSAMDKIKKAVKDGYPEDSGKDKEDDVEKLTKQYSENAEKLLQAKEKDLMSI